MGLTIPVILNSVNNLSDARYAAGMGVDFMGFQVEESGKRYVSLDLFKAITAWLSGIKTVTEVTVLTPSALTIIQEQYQPDFIQFESVEGISQHDLAELPCIQKIGVPAGQEVTILSNLAQYVFTEADYVLLELSDWTNWSDFQELIKEVNTTYPVLWSLPIEKEDAALIQDIELKGVSLKGGDEQRPGWKDLDQLIDILEALEEN